jgi:DNA-binding NarL/FixJ family response regulator
MVLRCLIVDDHVMFGQLLSTMLAPMSDLKVIGMAHTCQEGLELSQTCKPDLLILDLNLPDGSGCSVAHGALKANPDIRVLVLSAAASSFACPPELQSRVLEVIDKTDPFTSLTAALIRVILDHSPGKLHGRLASIDPMTRLTPRQQDVFRLIGTGVATKEIARTLELEKTTVETHRKEIARRLGVSGAELVRLAALQVCSWPWGEAGERHTEMAQETDILRT